MIDFDNFVHLVDWEKVVYRCYAANGDLLYVGCTAHLRKRLATHRCRAPWWPDVASIETEPPVGRILAMSLERSQIIHLAPLHNKVANFRRGWNYQRGTGGLAYFPARDEFYTDHSDERAAA